MRRIVLMLGISATVAAVTAADVRTSAAQTDFPFGTRPFCTSGNRGDGGMPICRYYTWEQCRAALSGGDHCMENPTLAWGRLHGVPQGKRKKRRY